jgi:hypothetical protein
LFPPSPAMAAGVVTVTFPSGVAAETDGALDNELT